MTFYEMVDSHSQRISSACQALKASIDEISGELSSRIVQDLTSTLAVSDGVVKQTSFNSSKILNIEGDFKRHLSESQYFPTVMAFMSEFNNQVDEFSLLYSGMSVGLGLPYVSLDSEDQETLLNQVGFAAMVIEGHAQSVSIDLVRSLSRLPGEPSVGQLINSTSESIRKMSKVDLIGKDQLTLFFRKVGCLVYRKVERSGLQVKYKYVGSRDTERDFCKKISLGPALSSQEIGLLDNGQIPGSFENAGGYGCGHWWAISEVA